MPCQIFWHDFDEFPTIFGKYFKGQISKSIWHSYIIFLCELIVEIFMFWQQWWCGEPGNSIQKWFVFKEDCLANTVWADKLSEHVNLSDLTIPWDVWKTGYNALTALHTSMEIRYIPEEYLKNTAAPNIGFFVLTLINFSYRFQMWPQNWSILIFRYFYGEKKMLSAALLAICVRRVKGAHHWMATCWWDSITKNSNTLELRGELKSNRSDSSARLATFKDTYYS